MKVKSVTEEINELLKPRLNSDDDSDEENTAPRVVEFEQTDYELPDAKSTDFRKKNVKLLSELSDRYKGKITSRKELRHDEDSDEDEVSDNDGNDAKFQDSSDEEGMGEEADEVDTEEEESGEADFDDDSDEADFVDESDDNETGTKSNVVSESNRQAEIQKGVCVQNQLRIWERLLEYRIHIQKVIVKANQLPIPADSNQSEYTTDVAKEATEKTCHLLKSLLDLKTVLTSQFSELQTHLKRPLEENSGLNDYVSGAPPLKRIALHLEDQHNQMRTYRNKVLLKWDDRTKLLKPGGAKRKINEEFDIIRKIDNALLNKDALISKSRILQNANPATEQAEETPEDTAEQETTASNTNVYDDSDFYHQQLRELIEYKASSSSNLAEVTKQMVELQKIRRQMKKKVDTRASKGRKIRYVVHNKLVNFLAPDDTSSAQWTNESKDELYKSLFAT